MNINDIKKPINEVKQVELQALRDVMNSGGDVNEWLTTHGWSFLARGAYSLVYEKSDSPFVIKALGGQGIRIKNELKYRCALSWMRFSQKNFHKNKHLPRIYYIQTKSTPSSYDADRVKYFVVMEKLQSSDSVRLDQILFNQNDMVAVLFMSRYLFELLWGKQFLEELSDMIQSKYKISINELFKKNVAEGHELSIAATYVDAIQSSFDCHEDLHTGNILMRGDVPVINDPFEG